LNFAATLVVAYLAGALPSAVWVSKIAFKKDVRRFGSQNAGLTNIYRVFGWKAAVPVALLDFGKGFFSAWLGNQSGQVVLEGRNFALISGLACILGHSYTCFAGFKGGKGVLAGFGVYLYLAPLSAAGAFVVWLGVLLPSRYVSLASLSAALSLSLFITIEYAFKNVTATMFFLTLAISGFIVLKHRSNIKRLLAGGENRFGDKTSAIQSEKPGA
jgi:glycerol-3-phosphate acyltransferase PlsY